MGELEQWFYFCFAQYSGREIHSKYIGWSSRMHSRVTLKLKATSWSTWHLLSLLVFVLPRWFCICFVRILGQEIHSNYRRLRGLHAWPWNWLSRHGLRDICHSCLYSCYLNDFFCFMRFLGQGIHSNNCHSRDLRMTLKLRVTSWSMWHLLFLGTCMCPTTMIFFSVFRSRNSLWLLPLAWPSRMTLKRKHPSWSTCLNNLAKQKVT